MIENQTALDFTLGYAAFFAGIAVTVLFRYFVPAGATIERNSTEPAPHDGDATAKVNSAACQLRDVAQNLACDVNAHRMIIERVSARLGASLAADSPDEQLILNATVELLDANFELQSQLSAAEEKIETQAKEISVREHEAATDPLTRLPNRRTFDARLAESLAELESRRQPFSVVMFDVDYFKQFNDAHGHVAGDEALRRVGQTLRQLIKRADVACRYGGEEFALILRGASVAEAKLAANRLRAAVEAMPIEFEGGSLSVTVSIGVAEANPGDDARQIISRADACVYASKNAGRNCVHWHNGAECVLVGERRAGGAAGDRSDASRVANFGRRRTGEHAVIADRAVLVSLLQRRVAESARSGEPLAVLQFGLPGFDRLQESIGDQAAENLEAEVALAIVGSLREMDYVGRWTDAEYTILLPRCTEPAAKIVAQRLIASVKSALGSTVHAKELEPIVGIAPVAHADTAEQVIELARRQLAESTVPA